MDELNNKTIRDQREFEAMFKNPKHARATWSQAVIDRYCKTALKPIAICDKDGNLTPTSQIELAVWEHLCNELKAAGSDRLPTEGEMMEACQQYYARHNSSSYVARRDSMGAKPVDETKQSVSVNNPLEDMSDEELLVMQKALEEHRVAKQKRLAEVSSAEVPEDK
jgi:hypothetical protein